jgi:SAM-dependent methyltransferase
MIDKIQRNWDNLNAKLAQDIAYWYLTPTNYAMLQILNNYMEGKHYRRVLDVGAGRLVFKTLLRGKADQYFSLDIQKIHDQQDIVASGAALPIKKNSLDLVICSAVLEHAVNPSMIINEIYEVLSPSGTLILTLPHFHYIHGEPNDFWRFTEFGARKLIEQSGFGNSKVTMIEVGYLINFLFSTFMPLMGGVIGISKMNILFRLLSVFFYKLDRLLKIKKLALGYIAFVIKTS